jgi:hypothetical protein
MTEEVAIEPVETNRKMASVQVIKARTPIWNTSSKLPRIISNLSYR